MATTCFHKWREDEVHSPWQLLEVEGTEWGAAVPRSRAVRGWLAAGLAAPCCAESRHRLAPSSCSISQLAHSAVSYALSHLFVNVSMPSVKQAVSPHCGWLSTLRDGKGLRSEMCLLLGAQWPFQTNLTAEQTRTTVFV